MVMWHAVGAPDCRPCAGLVRSLGWCKRSRGVHGAGSCSHVQGRFPHELSKVLRRHPLPRRGQVRAAHARLRHPPDRAAGAVGHRRRRLEGRDARHPRGVRRARPLDPGGAPRGSRRPQGGRRSHRRVLRGARHRRPRRVRVRLQARSRSGPAAGLLRRTDGSDGGRRADRDLLRQGLLRPGQPGGADPVPARDRPASRLGADRRRHLRRYEQVLPRRVLPPDRGVRARGHVGRDRRAPLPAARMDRDLLGRSRAALPPPPPDGHEPQELVDGARTPRVRPVLHGHEPGLDARERALPHDAPADRGRWLAMLYGLLQELPRGRAALRRRRVPPVPADVPDGSAC